MEKCVNVIGAGLAGVECAYQLSKYGIKVKLYEMKPNKKTDAHKSDNFAELVCSNSLKSLEITNACGLLKKELEILDSIVIKVAKQCAVPAGSALAVDRDEFSSKLTQIIKEDKNIEIISKEVEEIDPNSYTIIATGPLTTSTLCENLSKMLGEKHFYFYDAASPIVTSESLDFDKCFIADRYNKGDADYLNCGMNKEEYLKFVNELVNAETVELKSFEDEKVFEGCMPVEVMAKRGIDALRFGPLKPIGIVNPKTNESYYAVVQLRKENREGTLYNIVGFQTNLKFGEQKRVFSLISGLENAEFIRYGVMHRNTFINAPKLINKFYQLKQYEKVFIAGQLSGVEGYVESIASGLMCAINMVRLINSTQFIEFSSATAIGSLGNFIASASEKNFQPMNSNYGIMTTPLEKFKDKNKKKELMAERAIEEVKMIKAKFGLI
ncbi:MAG: methylenetetrahydrofolate--tRNA-(uracil(54)-C(5))-methyltransferase (FADH(2)-oxidizing) TrmFO [Clostridia bacterium]|nr:methylenetetrahydrofolate--tRNA-(uracil(54)-C(5))-methyltransferase (FADH(2)-oxidizing) TrmFO [Clostridia bacterium]